MTRFDYDDGDHWDYGRYMLWETAQANAISGKRGQQALRDLEQALLELPEPKLISGRLAENGQVCAVGALVAKRCVERGESRDEVLARMERAIPDDGYEDGSSSDVTATFGVSVGLAYSLAWRLGELNDEDCRSYTPEERYRSVLAWVRRAQLPTGAASA